MELKEFIKTAISDITEAVSELQGRVKMLEKLLDEKERLIKVLMEK